MAKRYKLNPIVFELLSLSCDVGYFLSIVIYRAHIQIMNRKIKWYHSFHIQPFYTGLNQYQIIQKLKILLLSFACIQFSCSICIHINSSVALSLYRCVFMYSSMNNIFIELCIMFAELCIIFMELCISFGIAVKWLVSITVYLMNHETFIKSAAA